MGQAGRHTLNRCRAGRAHSGASSGVIQHALRDAPRSHRTSQEGRAGKYAHFQTSHCTGKASVCKVQALRQPENVVGGLRLLVAACIMDCRGPTAARLEAPSGKLISSHHMRNFSLGKIECQVVWPSSRQNPVTSHKTLPLIRVPSHSFSFSLQHGRLLLTSPC